MKSERDGINPAAKPSGTDCVECSAVGGWWLHLRRCVECGHIGCCDTSPNQHASKHNAATGHPIITSFEPGERWFYDYRTGDFLAGPKLHVSILVCELGVAVCVGHASEPAKWRSDISPLRARSPMPGILRPHFSILICPSGAMWNGPRSASPCEA
ncbi:UBP-type zinc finger domain-containing protein [Bradyrhizobium sp.]|uniref:UBP-type zinc finger domain-containing protein n=1 Tax=Bradyrhizobium sp. TaxID=376 RepID=UPI002D4FC4B2|nr:UBP-type zinc finger domain-containing protein [Bradyrhizobium sp.]HZR73953.1 UBP-type zinc finger domain-containing protein [Bradyrhizobium sp.]